MCVDRKPFVEGCLKEADELMAVLLVMELWYLARMEDRQDILFVLVDEHYLDALSDNDGVQDV